MRRHASLALVCRRWAALVNAPRLLGTVDVWIDRTETSVSLAALRALTAWLTRRAAGHVRRLCLCLAFRVKSGRKVGECNALLATALTACAAGGALTELRLEVQWPVVLSEWLLPLSGSLRRLVVRTEGAPLVISSSLAAFTALEELALRAMSSDVNVQRRARLPASLTRFELAWTGDNPHPALPEQVRAAKAGRRAGQASWGCRPAVGRPNAAGHSTSGPASLHLATQPLPPASPQYSPAPCRRRCALCRISGT